MPLTEAAGSFKKALTETFSRHADHEARIPVKGTDYDLGHGDVVIAAITCCTNTSNPSVMLGAGLVARKAVEARPQGQAVGQDLARAGLPGGHRLSDRRPGCRPISTSSASTWSAMAAPPASAIPARCPIRSPRRSTRGDLVAAAVLSGNRNFEGRVNPQVKANYLASPPLVVAYALAGSMKIDLTKDPLGYGKNGKPVYLKDIWPTNKEIADACARRVTPAMFKKRYARRLQRRRSCGRR